MITLDDLPFDEVVSLLEQKHFLTKAGDLPALINLKRNYPELFMEEKQKEFMKLMDTIEMISGMPHFKERMLEERKRKLVSIDFEDWKLGLVAEVIDRHEIIRFPIIHALSRALVKECLYICKEYCKISDYENDLDYFPFIGLLLNLILSALPIEKRQRNIERIFFKLHQGKSHHFEIPGKFLDSHLTSLDVSHQIQPEMTNLFKIITQKFDSRDGFYTDLIFFTLIEVSEFLGLLLPIFYPNEDQRKIMIDQIIQHLLI